MDQHMKNDYLTKINVFDAIKRQSDAGVLVHPFNNPPSVKKDRFQKLTDVLNGFSNTYDEGLFKDYVEKFKPERVQQVKSTELKNFPDALETAVKKSTIELKGAKSSTSEVDITGRKPVSRTSFFDDQKQAKGKKYDIKNIEMNIKKLSEAFPSNKVSNFIECFYLIQFFLL